MGNAHAQIELMDATDERAPLVDQQPTLAAMQPTMVAMPKTETTSQVDETAFAEPQPPLGGANVAATMVVMPHADTSQPGESDAGESLECRICLMDEDSQSLVAPCGCQGSVKYVHMECLRTWCRERASLKCEICHEDYDVDSFSEADRGKILDAFQAAQAEQAMERERQRQRRQAQLQLGMRGDRDFLTLDIEEALRGSEGYESVEDAQERVAQVRRLVMFAALITITMLMFHLVGSILLSHAMESSSDGVHPNAAESAEPDSTHSVGSSDNGGDPLHHNKDGFSPAVSRVIRVLVFFYIIRSLVFRPPDDGTRMGRGRGIDFL